MVACQEAPFDGCEGKSRIPIGKRVSIVDHQPSLPRLKNKQKKRTSFIHTATPQRKLKRNSLLESEKRSHRRKSRSVPKGGADFPAAIFLSRKCPNLGRDRISCCRKIGEKFFPAASKFAGKPFQQRISGSHSLLELSD